MLNFILTDHDIDTMQVLSDPIWVFGILRTECLFGVKCCEAISGLELYSEDL